MLGAFFISGTRILAIERADIVNISLHFLHKDVRPYAASCSEKEFVLYHGSYCEVKEPELAKCAKRKDFWQGFYLDNRTIL